LKLGLFTAAFGDRPIEDVARWAAEAGFEALEVHRPPGAPLDFAVDLEVSALAYYPNPLDPDEAGRELVHAHLRHLIDAAARLEIGLVCTFAGADPRKTLDENLTLFRHVWPPLIGYAEERGVRIAIENCPMVYDRSLWPGGINLAYCPAAWDAMFEAIPSPALGLNLDPSHLVWLQIDYERAVRDYGDRIFHVHAKDTEIVRDELYRRSILTPGWGWEHGRIPGRGEIDWGRFVGALRDVGYAGAVSVEHEDRDVGVEAGFELARDTLRPLL
jgi:sugar phosphate isomerase/epimerase